MSTFWVFTFPAVGRYRDRQVSERRLLQYLQRILKKIGLPGHLHTFRHAFISLALINGVPEATVRKWVGHVDPETMKRYTHGCIRSFALGWSRLRNVNRRIGENFVS